MVEQYVVAVNFVVAGSADDYLPAKLDDMADVFAARANVSASSVSMSVEATSMSVEVTAKIIAPSATASAAIVAELAPDFITAATATAFFTAVPGGIAVMQKPDVVTFVERIIRYPPPSPSAPITGGGTKDDGLSGGALAGIIIACIAGTMLLGASYYRYGKKADKSEPQSSNRMAKVQMEQITTIENV